MVTIQTLWGEVFDMPVDTQIEITRYNQLITDYSDQSLPINLDDTPHNLRLLGYSNRLDNYFKPVKELQVIFSDRLYTRKCNMVINDMSDGISATIYPDSGNFYSVVGEQRINQLPWPEIQLQGANQANKVDYLINLLKNVYVNGAANPNSSMFRIAPLYTGKTFTEDVLYTEWERPQILNGFDFSEGLRSGLSKTMFAAERVRTYIENNSKITIGKGYGMTPFLRLNYVLNFLFSHFGYSYDYSLLLQKYQRLEDMCVANNVIDAIYTGVLRFKQLLPDVTIKEFLSTLKTFFCGNFVFDDLLRRVSFQPFQTSGSTPSIDLTPYLCSKPKFSTWEFKKVVLTNQLYPRVDSENDNNEILEIPVLNYTDSIPIVDKQEVYFHGREDIFTFPLQIMECNGYIHSNSTLLVNNQIQKEDGKASSEIQLITVTDALQSALTGGGSASNPNFYFYYRATSPIFADSHMQPDSISLMDLFYADYKAFCSNSNVAIIATVELPQQLLCTLTMENIVMLHNQPVFIESLQQTSNLKEQQIVFRTIRPFVDRS